MSKWGWFALVAIATTSAAERAEACGCSPVLEVVHPSTTSIAAWDGLVGRAVFVGTPTVSVTYVDDPAQQPIDGTLTNLSGSDVVALWTFVPSAPLTVGRTVRAVVSAPRGSIAPRSYDFHVSTASVGAGPSFPGVTSMTAVVSNFHGSAGGSCRPSEERQSRIGFPGLPPPSAEGPVYRYYIYPRGGSGAVPSRFGVAGHYIQTIRCGNPALLCEPTFSGLTPGETICARVEAVDLMGRVSGHASEVCTTVGEEEVDLVQGRDFREVSCAPRETDAGLVESMDAGSTAPPLPDATADAGVVVVVDAGAASGVDAGAGGVGGGGESSGCVCVRGGGDGDVGSAWGLLACALVVVVRRRARR